MNNVGFIADRLHGLAPCAIISILPIHDSRAGRPSQYQARLPCLAALPDRAAGIKRDLFAAALIA